MELAEETFTPARENEAAMRLPLPSRERAGEMVESPEPASAPLFWTSAAGIPLVPPSIQADNAPTKLSAATSRPGRHGWTIVVLAIGIGIIACCLLIPQADENRQLLYQTDKLKADLAHVEKQVQINDEFIQRVRHDPVLAERLAQRQMNCIRRGTSVLDLKHAESIDQRSPFSLVTMPSPPQIAPYKPVRGHLAELCRDSHNRLRMLGGGLVLLAAGLILGQAAPKP